MKHGEEKEDIHKKERYKEKKEEKEKDQEEQEAETEKKEKEQKKEEKDCGEGKESIAPPRLSRMASHTPMPSRRIA